MIMSTFSGCFTGEGTPLKLIPGPQADVEVEHLAQRDVQRADAAANRRGQRTLDPHEIVTERLHRLIGQPVLEAPVQLSWPT